MALLETAGVNLATSQALYDGSSGYREPDLYNAATRTFTEVVAATPLDWGGFYVWSKAERVGWLSVAVGAAGSEVIIATIQVSISAPRSFYVPIPVAAGTRVSVAHAGWTAGKLWAGVSGVPASSFDTVPSFTRLEVGPIYLDGGWTDYIYAVDVAAPGADNTKGAFTEISADHFVVATGSRPRGLPDVEIDGSRILTSDHLLTLNRHGHRPLEIGPVLCGVHCGDKDTGHISTCVCRG